MLDVPEELLAERRRRNADCRDEVWEGVLHMVPQPSSEHQRLGSRLVETLSPVARGLGLETFYEISVYREGSDEDYRVPDLSFVLPAHVSKRGIEGPCELAVELLSPGDESYEKLAFYASVGVREVLMAEPGSRKVELYVLRGNRHVLMSPDEKNVVRSAVLGVAFVTVDGPKLAMSWAGGRVEV